MFFKLFQRAWFGGDFASIIGECACPRGSVFNNRELRCDSELFIWNFNNIFKIYYYVLKLVTDIRDRVYPKLDFRVPGISQKMGLRQVEQGVSSFFAIFDDFSMFHSTFACSTLKNHQLW